MLLNKIQNIFLSSLYKTILACFIFFVAINVDAQDDSINKTNEEEFQKIEKENTDGETDLQKNHFLNKADFETKEVILRKIPDSVIQKQKGEKAFWYADKDFDTNEIKKANDNSYLPASGQNWIQTLLWLLIIGGFAASVIWYLADSRVGLFRKKIKKIITDTDGTMPEDIFAINYQKEIDKATAQSDYRTAVRLMFLRLLKNLSERNIIQYKQDKTNLDYLLQLHPTVFYKNFFRITRNYEYSWYGKFDVSEKAYHTIRSEFDNFENMLN